MLLSGVLVALVAKHVERVDEAGPCGTGVDDVINVAPPCSDVGVSELSPVFLDADPGSCLRILGSIEFLPEEHFDGALGAHDRDLRGRPSQVHIPSDVLGAHHVVGTAICLPDDDRDLRNRRLGECVEQFRAVPDDATVLLPNPRQEPGDILEDDQRDVEDVAKSYETRSLYRGVDVQNPGEDGRLIGDDPDRMPPEVRKANDKIPSERLVDLVELPIIHHAWMISCMS